MKRQRVNPPDLYHGIDLPCTRWQKSMAGPSGSRLRSFRQRAGSLLAIDAPAQALKRRPSALEQRYHWDIDRRRKAKYSLAAIFALPARRCLLCGQSAASNTRGVKPRADDLLTHMEALCCMMPIPDQPDNASIQPQSLYDALGGWLARHADRMGYRQNPVW